MGMTSEPIAAVSAMADPDTPPNSRQETTVTTPSPPGSNPKSVARERDDALADAALGQQFAAEDEERHGDQDEGLDAADEAQEDRLQRMGRP